MKLITNNPIDVDAYAFKYNRSLCQQHVNATNILATSFLIALTIINVASAYLIIIN